MNKFAVLLFLSLTLFSCKKETITLDNNVTFQQKVNISYGENSEQKMDLYFPKNKNSIKTIFIIIHGGGWKAGRKSDLTLFTLSMMKRFPQSAFANMNYRLASETRFGLPNQTDDIQKVIDYLTATFPKDAQFVLMGNSAGGHLSMLYSYRFDEAERIKAVVNIVGPSDLSDSNFKNYSDYSFVENRLVDPASTSKSISKTDFASPIHWISENSPPTVSFYGNHDLIIPISQKAILDSVLDKNKVLNESYEFTGGHLDWEKGKNTISVINSIDKFLKIIDKK